MEQNDRQKQLALEMIREIGTGSVFNYVFNNTLILGTTFDLTDTHITEGTSNNIVGAPNHVADVFYKHILLYAAQIKEVTKLNSIDTINNICKRLARDAHVLDGVDAPISFKTAELHTEGTA